MKSYKTLTALAALTGLSLCSSVHAQTLFSDNFNRADGTDLNAATTGKSGSLGALTWLERSAGGDGGDALISSNTLKIGENATGGGNSGFATAYLNHNFTDGTITSGGEFTVSVDLVGPIASGGGTRFTGFSVGNSLAEVANWNSNNPPSSFTSDFFFGYDPTGTTEVKIFDGTTQLHQQTINLSTTGATLSVRFFGISDFNAGSTVNYEAFINGGTAVDTGSFTWSGTNENYLNVYSNYTSNSGTLDNFAVTAVPESSAALLIGLAGLALLRRRRA